MTRGPRRWIPNTLEPASLAKVGSPLDRDGPKTLATLSAIELPPNPGRGFSHLGVLRLESQQHGAILHLLAPVLPARQVPQHKDGHAWAVRAQEAHVNQHVLLDGLAAKRGLRDVRPDPQGGEGFAKTRTA